jgi:DNA-binding transcriptional MerR regulator
MTTPIATDVIRGGAVGVGIVANDAHELAGITYRQLDHWARQGWVLPSIDAGKGRSGRRLYSPDDVVRLDLLRHLAMSKVNTAHAGPRVAELQFGDADTLVLWGPVGGRDTEAELAVRDRGSVVRFLADGGAWVVFDPQPVSARVARLLGTAHSEPTSGQAQRRSA